MASLDDTLQPTGPGAAGADGALPARIGPYRITGLLGRGGMGEVYAGVDDKLGRPVAIKRVAAPLRGVAEARARFWREARALAAVDHPGVVRVHRVDETAEGDLYLAMAHVDGVPLSAHLGATPWPPAAVHDLLRQAADALGAAHRAGLVHRDVKPGNLLVDAAGRVVLVDFGLARSADGLEDRVTATGAVLGTPAWMAPEQVDGAGVTPATDVFALGAVAYRLLAGRHPFARESREATALALAAGRYPPLGPLAPQAPAALVALVDRCLARDPSARPPDGAALAAALDDRLGPPTPALADLPAPARDPGRPTPSAPAPALLTTLPPARRGWPWIAALAVVLTAGGLWWAGRPSGPPPVAAPPPGVTLPARPVVAVFDLTGPQGAVVADALRHQLDTAPDRLAALDRAAMVAAVGPGRPLDQPPAALPADGPGRVDVVVTGAVQPRPDGLVATLSLRRHPTGPALGQIEAAATDAVALAPALAGPLASALGQPPLPAPPALTTSPAAWAHHLAALRAQETGDLAGFERELALADRADPRFAPAQLELLESLRAARRFDALAAQARTLLEAALPPRLEAHARAWLALGQGDTAQALRILRDLGERWPRDVSAGRLRLAIRFHDPVHGDLAVAEQIGRELLAVAPYQEDVASRLLRAMAIRGKASEVGPLFARLGVPRDAPALTELWADLALFQGRYDDALAGYREAERLAGGEDFYSHHMAIAAQILAGDCAAAAAQALARIDRVAALGRDFNLDWTYSLASQALLCRQAFGPLAGLLDRWAGHSDSGRAQVPGLRARARILAGDAPAAVAAWIEGQLADADTPAGARLDLLGSLARTATDAATLRRHAEAAEARSLDGQTPPTERAAWAGMARSLVLRARLLSEPGDEVLADLAAAVPAPETLRAEGQLALRVSALVHHAEALAVRGRAEAAQAVWRDIAQMGYARLWVTDLWVTATARQGEGSGGP
ncbi:MAG: protein kinase [Myxococcales bacterium]|nr:protein kinase [Myxococcales bacterium]